MPLPSFKKLRVGSRGSALALAQTQSIVTQIQKQKPGLLIEVVTIQTSGDKFRGERLAQAGGKGLFVKELEEALLSQNIDLAVHSLKDMPGLLPDGLTLAPFPKREDPRDCFISLDYDSFEKLPPRAIVGSSSPRRQAQIYALRPDLKVKPIRGNVDTRLKKLKDGEYDALILAAAGLNRLQRTDVNPQYFSPDFFVPAVGQGILGIEIKKGRLELAQFLNATLGDSVTTLQARAERAFLETFGGDCYTPLGAHAIVEREELKMIGWWGRPDGKKTIRREKTYPSDQPEHLGRELAKEILDEIPHH